MIRIYATLAEATRDARDLSGRFEACWYVLALPGNAEGFQIESEASCLALVTAALTTAEELARLRLRIIHPGKLWARECPDAYEEAEAIDMIDGLRVAIALEDHTWRRRTAR